jgi:hypothetical protein
MRADEWLYSGRLNLDYNLVDCSGAPTQDHPVVGRPAFVNEHSDWHVESASPALGSGSRVEVKGFEGEDIDVSLTAEGLKRETSWNVGIY